MDFEYSKLIVAAAGILVMSTAAVADDAEPAAREYLTGDWGGTRSRWSENGVAIEPFLISDASRNTTGGLSVGSAFRLLAGVHFHLESGPALGYRGGRFMVEYYDFRGDNGTLDRVGDLQFFSNLDATEGGRLAQFHYRHTFGAGGEWIQFGNTDSNNDFAASEHSGLFIHSSAGFSPTILGFPTYPSPASAVLGWIERNNWYVHLGIFDGSTQSGIDTGGRGPASFFAFDGSYFSVVEGAWLDGDDSLKVGFGVTPPSLPDSTAPSPHAPAARTHSTISGSRATAQPTGRAAGRWSRKSDGPRKTSPRSICPRRWVLCATSPSTSAAKITRSASI